MSQLAQLLDKPSNSLSKSSRRSQHSFDATQEVLNLIEFPRGGQMEDEDDEVDADKLLRQLNNLDFRLQMHAQTSGGQLQRSTDEVIKAIKEVQLGSEAQQNLEELQFKTDLDKADDTLSNLRQEMIELLSVERRIKECQHMGREIEEFETRIQKVEEYIRSDDLVMLCQLVVGHLQGRMKLVRDMGKASTTSTSGQSKHRRGRASSKAGEQDDQSNQQVFRQHQQSRLQRFDKLILTYVQYKQNEILQRDGSKKAQAKAPASQTSELGTTGPPLTFDQAYKYNYLDINAILQLFNVFSPEQMNTFISQKLIKEKLLKEFNTCINNAKDQDVRDFISDHLGEDSKHLVNAVFERAKFICKFYKALEDFANKNKQFVDSIYDKMSKDHVARFWKQLFSQIFLEYGERLDGELNPTKQKALSAAKEEDGGAFCQLQMVVFEQIIVDSLERVLDVLFTERRFDKKGIQEAFAPIFKHLFEQLIESTLQRLNKQVLPAQCDLILASFQKYVDSHNSQNEGNYSKDSLSQLAMFFQEQMRRLEDVVKHQCLPLLVGMCQGYGLMEFINDTFIAQYLHKLTSQLTFLFNQLCSKRICYQLASLQSVQDLLSVEKTAQLSSSFQMQGAGQGVQSQMLSAAASLGSTSDLAFHLKSKFQWQNVFDLMKLHTVFRVSFGRGRLESESLKDCVNKLVEKHLRTSYKSSRSGVLSMLQAFMSDSCCLRKEMQKGTEQAKTTYQEVLEALITDGVSIRDCTDEGQPIMGPADLDAEDDDVLKLQITPLKSASLLLQCLHTNICKTFVMPIFTEIISIHKIGVWRECHHLKLSEGEEKFNIQSDVADSVQTQSEAQPPSQPAAAGQASGLVGGLSSFFVQNVTNLAQKGKANIQAAASSTGSQKKYSSTIKPPQPSEYVRNIGDHFISFIQQLDQFFDYEQQQQEQRMQEAELQNKEPPKPILSLEESEKENFGMLYISMLAIRLIEMMSCKYGQIQLLGGLLRPKNQATQALAQLERNDQVMYEYHQSSDSTQAGALQLIKDIDYIKKTFKQFCLNAPDEEQLRFFAQQSIFPDQSDAILSKKAFKPLNSIQLACALHPILVAGEVQSQMQQEKSADSVLSSQAPEFQELLDARDYAEILGQLRQVAKMSKAQRALLQLDQFEQNPLKKIAVAYLAQINDLRDVIQGLALEDSGDSGVPRIDRQLVDALSAKVQWQQIQ